MTAIDIQSLIAAAHDPGMLGAITAYSEMADELAQRDERYAGLAAAIGELWLALIAKNPVKVRRAACKVADECDRLEGGE
jgi:hypothetical protein